MAFWSDIYFEVSNHEDILEALIGDDKIVVLHILIFHIWYKFWYNLNDDTSISLFIQCSKLL